MTRFVPVLPESAPFTAEQRAWLNGFLAGLFSHAPVPGAATTPAAAPAPALAPLTVLYASQTGTAEKLARRIARTAGTRGFAATVHDLARYPREQLAGENRVLIVASTTGDGEPPDNAKAFWQWLGADSAPRLASVRFSLCALGDSNYPRFCAFGRELDARLESLGAGRVQPRVDCDVEPERPFAAWLAAALGAFGNTSETAATAPIARDADASPGAEATAPAISAERPFPARLRVNRRLNPGATGKEVRHFELSLEGSGLTYEAGDALGIRPANCPELVEGVIRALGGQGGEAMPLPDGGTRPLREALTSDFEIARIPLPLLRHFAERTGDTLLTRLTAPDVNGELTSFLRGRDVLDLLHAYPGVRPSPAEIATLLRRLQPRLYSISSSPKAAPGHVHLTVSAVRYESHGRPRKGVASTFLADRCDTDTPVPVHVHENPAFRPPPGDRPLIMVGPGTGIAPFRAFLQERRAIGASGRNWLFFGDQHAATDYLYRDEIEGFHRDGLLTRLDLAWSRDQADKIYVQHRMREHASELFAWLEEGATFCVCGDASRMAKDVDAALQQVIEGAGRRSPEQALQYVEALRADGRYRRDVY